MDDAFVRAFVDRWVGAWNAHDAAALLELCTDDVVFEDPSLPEPIVGAAAVRAFVGELATTFPDFRFEPTGPPYVSLDRPHAALPWRMTGTFLGPAMPSGMAPTGQRLDAPGVDLYEFRDDRVARYVTLYDLADFGRQMGVVPGRGSGAERTMVRMQRFAFRLRHPRTPLERPRPSKVAA